MIVGRERAATSLARSREALLAKASTCSSCVWLDIKFTIDNVALFSYYFTIE